MEKTTVLEFLQKNTEDIEQRLASVELRREPLGLYDAVKHVLESPGKRLRPQLALAASDIFGGSRAVAIEVAVAMEIFHIFTLVHDDIMDRSDSRRGHPTIHVKWDEPTAILAGDFLLGRASELILALPDSVLRLGLVRFGETVRALCEGQIRDMEFESRSDVELSEYLGMIDQKTSALLSTSLVLGAMTGTSSNDYFSRMDEIGHHLGQAFQIQDDLLDLTASSANWGKPLGGDLVSGKKTFLLIQALKVERETGKSYFHQVCADGGLRPDELPRATAILKEMGVLESAEKAVLFHSKQAELLCCSLPASTGRNALVALIDKMAVRKH
ncbi:MAG: polyprenyl synthetase family protein [Bacteroidetes bacterium]|nr:polyprenyl synthetase family protein [Bacteroidota bacterium]